MKKFILCSDDVNFILFGRDDNAVPIVSGINKLYLGNKYFANDMKFVDEPT